jgi:hypothetical protein
MKTFIYFVFTCFISTGALFGAMNAHNPFPAFAVAFGIWALFLWGYNKRSKAKSEKRAREQLFENYMRSKSRNNNQY